MFYQRIIKKFNNNEIKYVIVGGLAVNLHGYVRLTADLDILIDLEDANIKHTLSLLKEAGFNCKIPVDPMGLADAAIREDWIKNKNLKALNFYKEIEEIDLIIDSPVDYSSIEKVLFDVEGIIYPVASKNDIITMKRKADRPLDREDIKQLELLKGINAKNDP